MCMQRRIALIVGGVLAAFADGFHPHGERWHLSKFFNTFSIPSPLFSSRCESQGNSPLTRPLRSQRKRRLCCRLLPFPSLKELPLICDETTAIDFFRLFDARPAPHAFPRVDSAMTSYDHRDEILVGIFVAVGGDARQHASRVAFSARDICAVVAHPD